MGDRANIILTDKIGDETGRVYLYTHWNGYRIEKIAAQGLAEAAKAGRADDAQYGGRIITDVFLKAHALSPHLGAGVSGLIGDGDGHTVEIDFSTGTVDYEEPETGNRRLVTFAVFVSLFGAAE